MNTQPPYPLSEISRRGEALYEQHIRPLTATEDKGKGIVIDIESGAFEWEDAGNPLAASHRLLARNPSAVLYARRVGYRAHTKMSGSWRQSDDCAVPE